MVQDFFFGRGVRVTGLGAEGVFFVLWGAATSFLAEGLAFFLGAGFGVAFLGAAFAFGVAFFLAAAFLAGLALLVGFAGAKAIAGAGAGAAGFAARCFA